jgi:hypothetical protein
MLHLIPEFAPDFEPSLHPEPVSRMASLRNALRIADSFGGGPASDVDDDDDQTSARWASAGEAAKRCFDRRSAELIAMATDGLQVVAEQQALGKHASPAAMGTIAAELRSGMAALNALLG